MKKSLLVLSALMALSMAFVGCKGGASDPDISDPSVDVTPTELVVFEGEEVLTASGYDNYIEFDESLSGYSTFEVTLSWASEDGVQCQAQLMNDGSQASQTITFGSKSEATVSGKCMAGAKYDKWPGPVATDCDTSANKLQIYIQNASYGTTTGTVTVKKIVLK